MYFYSLNFVKRKKNNSDSYVHHKKRSSVWFIWDIKLANIDIEMKNIAR